MSDLDGIQQYRVGASARMLYLAAGGSDDWAKGAAGIRYSYTVELADTGRHGFVLPAYYIKPTGDQMFDAIRTLTLEVIRSKDREKVERRRKSRKRGRRPQGRRLSEEISTDQASADRELDELLTVAIL